MARTTTTAATLTGPCGGEGTGSAADYIPARPSLTSMRRSVDACRGCGLWACGHGVFGEGPKSATVMMVGEQPGDQEEVARRPFVGPSGKLLDGALEEAGIDRSIVYVTNAVKHFKYERGEKSARRIHKKPSDAEVRACHPWLLQEIKVTKPDLIVALGATAAQSLLGKQFRVTKMRGKVVESEHAGAVIATVHPSSILRTPGPERALALRDFVKDLKAVARYLEKLG
jgi:uracil-DNA glycosylase